MAAAVVAQVSQQQQVPNTVSAQQTAAAIQQQAQAQAQQAALQVSHLRKHE